VTTFAASPFIALFGLSLGTGLRAVKNLFGQVTTADSVTLLLEMTALAGTECEPAVQSAYFVTESFTMASTMLSIASRTRLLGRFKLLDKMANATCCPFTVVA